MFTTLHPCALPHPSPILCGMASENPNSPIHAGPDGDRDNRRGPGVGLATRTRPKTKKPSQYKVLLLNDDYTPMEFVVHVLEKFFSLNRPTATRIMLQVHTQGKGVCGIFTHEIAETKVSQVNSYARDNQHPLLCTLELDS